MFSLGVLQTARLSNSTHNSRTTAEPTSTQAWPFQYFALSLEGVKSSSKLADGRLKLLAKLLPMALDATRLDAVAWLVITSSTFRTLQYIHLEWKYCLLRMTTLTYECPCLAEMTTFHVSQALSNDRSKGRTQDPRSGVAEVVQAVHLVVRYQTSLYVGVQFWCQSAIWDVPWQLGQLSPGQGNLLQLFNLS